MATKKQKRSSRAMMANRHGYRRQPDKAMAAAPPVAPGFGAVLAFTLARLFHRRSAA